MMQISPACPPFLLLAPNIFLRYSCNIATRSVWELGNMAALLQTVQQLYPAASHSVSILYRVVSGEWRVFSGLSVFVNAETNIHIEIRVENFQLEQLLSDINQLNALSLLFNLYSAPRMLNSADFISLWPCIVCHYRWLRSPTRPPLATINQPFSKSVYMEPFSKSVYIESSDHVPSLFWLTGSFVQLVVWC
jgi:hypothetical protein